MWCDPISSPYWISYSLNHREFIIMKIFWPTIVCFNDRTKPWHIHQKKNQHKISLSLSLIGGELSHLWWILSVSKRFICKNILPPISLQNLSLGISLSLTNKSSLQDDLSPKNLVCFNYWFNLIFILNSASITLNFISFLFFHKLEIDSS